MMMERLEKSIPQYEHKDEQLVRPHMMVINKKKKLQSVEVSILHIQNIDIPPSRHLFKHIYSWSV